VRNRFVGFLPGIGVFGAAASAWPRNAGAKFRLMASGKRFVSLLVAVGAFGAALSGWPQAADPDIRFVALDIFVQTAEPLAAWQFELRESSGMMRVVGVENGDSAAFGDAPYYDLEAVNAGAADRIIVADYSLGSAGELPTGRSRIATIHVQLEGTAAPDYVVRSEERRVGKECRSRGVPAH